MAHNNSITPRDKDFALWYTDIVNAARLARYSSVKGCVILEPNGYALWENIQKVLDEEFKKLGHKNVYLPLLIPESMLKKEGELVEGFAPEVAWITEGGQKKLEERLCVRPTSESLFCDYYKDILKSYRDLPIKDNQWCSVLRWEKETRPFLRSREFLWQEGHTIHETRDEAEQETLDMLNVYKHFMEDYLAIPVLTGKKTEKEKFAGAEYTYTVEALMYNGVALQSGTSHYFGQKFSKAYDVKFLDRNNNYSYPYQTSWGVSTRMIGGLIMVHSDDSGLVLPPKIAPTKVAIIPIGTSEEVLNKCKEISKKLEEKGITNYIDDSEKSPGYKFAEAEVNGIPLRIDLGERDLNENKITFTRRDNKEKVTNNLDCDIIEVVSKLLDDIQENLYNKALERKNSQTYEAHSFEEMESIMNEHPGFVKAMWCGDEECELKVKEIRGTKSRCILEEKPIDDKCVVCGRPAKHLVVWGIQY